MDNVLALLAQLRPANLSMLLFADSRQWGRTEIPASSGDASIVVALPITTSNIINKLSACVSPTGITGVDTPNNSQIIVRRAGAWSGQLVVYWLLICN